MPPTFADNFVNIFIVSPGENTVLLCDLFKNRFLFSFEECSVVVSPLLTQVFILF
jgi:hypothetical protein